MSLGLVQYYFRVRPCFMALFGGFQAPPGGLRERPGTERHTPTSSDPADEASPRRPNSKPCRSFRIVDTHTAERGVPPECARAPRYGNDVGTRSLSNHADPIGRHRGDLQASPTVRADASRYLPHREGHRRGPARRRKPSLFQFQGDESRRRAKACACQSGRAASYTGSEKCSAVNAAKRAD